jgi:heptosyltransferase-2
VARRQPGGVLIVKLGAPGDVVRTTPLLRALKGPVTWVTAAESAPLLPRRPGLTVLTPADAKVLRGRRFELVLCLDDDPAAAALAESVRARRRVGARSVGGRLSYTADSRSWFDMGLLSRLGRRRADALKRSNRLSWQEHLFRMAGKRFRGEEYWLRLPPRRRGAAVRVGLEPRASSRWPTKAWTRFGALERALRARGVATARFSWKRGLGAHAAAVAACDVVVCGDTLTMHLALALRKRVVALFLCTPPQEIEDYGRLVKLVSPVLARHLYSRRRDRRAAGAIPLAPVLAETLTALSQLPPR